MQRSKYRCVTLASSALRYLDKQIYIYIERERDGEKHLHSRVKRDIAHFLLFYSRLKQRKLTFYFFYPNKPQIGIQLTSMRRLVEIPFLEEVSFSKTSNYLNPLTFSPFAHILPSVFPSFCIDFLHSKDIGEKYNEKKESKEKMIELIKEN